MTNLEDKIKLYTELTGKDGKNVPIFQVANFLINYEMKKEKENDKKRN